MIKCPSCNGELEFNVELQKVKCQYCGSTFDPRELNEKVKMSEENNQTIDSTEDVLDDTFEGKAYACSQCGATLLTFDETAVTFCSYCGSQAMLATKVMQEHKPDSIIPFQKTKEECMKAYKERIKHFLFAPNYLKLGSTVEKFRGIYMPYAIYYLIKDGVVHNEGSKYSHRSGDYVYYDDYDISCNVKSTYAGISFDLLSNFYDKYSHAIPFNYKEAVEFNPNYLTGFYADSSDVHSNVYADNAIDIAKEDASKKLKKVKELSKYGCSKPKISFGIKDKKTGLFPVYFLSIRNLKNERVHYAVANGQTGKIAVDLPISFPKYIIASLLLAVIIFLLVNSFLVLTPKEVTFFSIIAGIVSLYISIKQKKKLDKQARLLDDEGIAYVKDIAIELDSKDKKNFNAIKKKSKPKKSLKERLRYVWKAFLAILLPIVVLFSNVVDDSYYYGISILSLILVIFSFYDLVKEYNMLSSHPLPQLGKRGGDENE